MGAALAFSDPWPSARRLVCVDPARFASSDPAETDARLGRAIERLRSLGATHVVIDAVARSPEGRIDAAWFPTRELPVRQDLLSRLAAQMRSRAGVGVAVRLPHAAALAALADPSRTQRLFEDLATYVPFDALVIEDAPAFGRGSVEQGAATPAPWQLARAREAEDLSRGPPGDALAMRTFLAVRSLRPQVELFWLAPAGTPMDRPSPLADLTLVPLATDADPLRGRRLQAPGSRRVGAWWQAGPLEGAALAGATRRLQAAGVTALGWCPDDPVGDVPSAAQVAPAWSGVGFPLQGGQP